MGCIPSSWENRHWVPIPRPCGWGGLPGSPVPQTFSSVLFAPPAGCPSEHCSPFDESGWVQKPTVLKALHATEPHQAHESRQREWAPASDACGSVPHAGRDHPKHPPTPPLARLTRHCRSWLCCPHAGPDVPPRGQRPGAQAQPVPASAHAASRVARWRSRVSSGCRRRDLPSVTLGPLPAKPRDLPGPGPLHARSGHQVLSGRRA